MLPHNINRTYNDYRIIYKAYYKIIVCAPKKILLHLNSVPNYPVVNKLV